jgi:hypothetical protein
MNTPIEAAKEKVRAKYPAAHAVQYRDGRWQVEMGHLVLRTTPGLGVGQTEDEAWLKSVALIDTAEGPK